MGYFMKTTSKFFGAAILGATLSLMTTVDSQAAMTQGEMQQRKSSLSSDIYTLKRDMERYERQGDLTRFMDTQDELELKELRIKQLDRRMKAFSSSGKAESKDNLLDKVLGDKNTGSPKASHGNSDKKVPWAEYAKKNSPDLFRQAIDYIENKGVPKIAAQQAQKKDNFFEQLGQFALSELLEKDQRAWPEALSNFQRAYGRGDILAVPSNPKSWKVPSRSQDSFTSMQPYYEVISKRLQDFLAEQKKGYEALK